MGPRGERSERKTHINKRKWVKADQRAPWERERMKTNEQPRNCDKQQTGRHKHAGAPLDTSRRAAVWPQPDIAGAPRCCASFSNSLSPDSFVVFSLLVERGRLEGRQEWLYGAGSHGRPTTGPRRTDWDTVKGKILQGSLPQNTVTSNKKKAECYNQAVAVVDFNGGSPRCLLLGSALGLSEWSLPLWFNMKWL